MALGNYSQAKMKYIKAVSSQTTIPQSTIAACYVACIENLHLQIGKRFLKHFVNRYRGPIAFGNLELASYLGRLSLILMVTIVFL